MPSLFETLRAEREVVGKAPWSIAAIVLVSLSTGFAAGVGASVYLGPLLAPHVKTSPPSVPSAAPLTNTPVKPDTPGNATAGNVPQAGPVTSYGQKGGVTAGNVGSVSQ